MDGPVVRRISAALIDDFWLLIAFHVKQAIAYHEFMNADDVRAYLKAGHGQLFIVTEGHSRLLGFGIMEVIQYPSRRVANIFLSGGERGFLGVAVDVLLPQLQAWAAEQATDAFAILGARPGWVRALSGKGFRSMAHHTLWTDTHVEGRRQDADADADLNG